MGGPVTPPSLWPRPAHAASAAAILDSTMRSESEINAEMAPPMPFAAKVWLALFGIIAAGLILLALTR